MLARIALDCDALLEESPDSVAQYHLHEELIRMLDRHGWLMIPEDRHILDVLQQLRGRGLRQLWAAWVEPLRSRPSNSPAKACLCRFADGTGFEKEWNERADLALLSTGRATTLGVPDGVAAIYDPRTSMELARLDIFYAAETFRALRDLADSTILKGECRETTWGKRFRPLAEKAKHITICDRYAGARLHTHYAKGQPNEAGLRWFLKGLSRCSTSNVHVITGAVDPQKQRRTGGPSIQPGEIEDAVDRLAQELPGRGVENMMLTVAPDDAFRDSSHDRHVRFDRSSIWIGRGLEIFERPTQGQDSSCQYVVLKSVRDRKDELVKAVTIHNESLRGNERAWPKEKPVRLRP